MLSVRVFTLYPEYFPGPLGKGLYGKALVKNLGELNTVIIRVQAKEKHKPLDDVTNGVVSGI